MKTIFSLLTVLAAAAGAFGQAEIPPQQAPSTVNCGICHQHASPTKEKPALLPCPRSMSGTHSARQAPHNVILGAAEGKYARVKFSHKTHAEMAEMGGGCYRCHHYDRGGRIQKCGSCHSAARLRSDLSTPDLKGAVHQLCVECHREWGQAADCAVCHGNKPMPRPEIPEQIGYRTAYSAGRTVTFIHPDHTAKFGLKCSACHREQSCKSCHETAGNGAPPRGGKNSGPARKAHQRCFPCHAKDSCLSCHAGRPADAFDHGRNAGWRLNRFHNSLECRRCHSEGKFAKLNTGCQTCHKDWQNNFDHKKTGLALDPAHSALACDACHGDKEFSAPPACSACHDKSYPKDRPGHLTGEK